MKPEDESIELLAARFRRDGVATLRQVFAPAEVARLRREADALFRRQDVIGPANLRTEYLDHEGQRRVNKYDPVTDISPAFAAAARNLKISSMLRDIWGEEAALFKDKLVFKMPGHQGFGPHQDHVWWHPFPTSLITVSVAIDSADQHNGALEVAPGYQDLPNPVPKGMLRDLTPDESPPESAWERVDMQAGDVVIFGCLTPHRSGPNVSRRHRRMLHLTFNPISAGDLYLAHYRHLRAYMLGAATDYGTSTGNGYVVESLRGRAAFFPPVKGELA